MDKWLDAHLLGLKGFNGLDLLVCVIVVLTISGLYSLIKGVYEERRVK